MSMTEYQVQIDDSIYKMKLPNNKYLPHTDYAALVAVQRHCNVEVASIQRWRMVENYCWYIVELQDGRTVPCAVKRI